LKKGGERERREGGIRICLPRYISLNFKAFRGKKGTFRETPSFNLRTIEQHWGGGGKGKKRVRDKDAIFAVPAHRI